MKKIDFKKIAAKNFLCFGEKGIEIKFENYGNIVLVKGRNLDTAKNGSEDRIASNGSGKSSIPEIIVYGLYGKTIKSPKKISHKDVMHINASKNLSVEIYWDEYKLERKRKPDSLRLWKSADGKFDDTNEMTLGGMPATQKLVEDILGLNYQTFINIFIFTDDNSASFLECDAAEKRNIVENLLSLEKYRNFHETAKTQHKEHVAKIKNLQTECDYIGKSVADEEKNIEGLKLKKKLWQQKKLEDAKHLNTQISEAEKEIKILEDSTDNQQYEKAQAEIKTLLEKIEKLQADITTNTDVITKLYSELQKSNDQKSNLEQNRQPWAIEKKNLASEIQKLAEVVAKINKLEPGVVCGHCYGEIKPENYGKIKDEHIRDAKNIKVKFDQADAKLKEIDAELAVVSKDNSDLKIKYDTLRNDVIARESKVRSYQTQVQNLQKIKIPDNTLKKSGIEEKIKLLKSSIKNILEELKGISPYDDLLSQSDAKLTESKSNKEVKDAEVVQLKEDTDYLAFWTVAFGDAGIRKYIIDEIIPALNQNVNYWLQFLIDNKLEINFDNELNEQITKFPELKPLSYHVLSNGQRRRINLALSQSFAHVMSLNTGKYPSLVFLDEVTTNIDPAGVEGIYNMICELSKEKQVVVTTHDHDLLELLNGCQELNLRMQNGTSFLEK